MARAKIDTPILKFLRALGTKEAKERFASECGTTLLYLYQIGAQTEPNPRLQLARSIKTVSAKWARKLHVAGLDYDDLLTGAVESAEPKAPEAPAPVGVPSGDTRDAEPGDDGWAWLVSDK